jgi:hypothetical protein
VVNAKEGARGKDTVAIKNVSRVSDRGRESAVWKIRRWASEEDKKNNVIYPDKVAKKFFGGVKQCTIIEGKRSLLARLIFPLIGKRRLLYGNALVNEGINEMWTLMCSAGGTKFDNTNAVLCVGTGSGAENPTDTRATFTTPVEKAMDGGFPTYGTIQKAIWQATYGSGDANQAWEEFGVLNTITTGKLMNRKISSQGTKTVGQTWELTLEITLS